MTFLDLAEAEFRKIFPAGADAPHEYAAAGFRFLAKAREEMEKLQAEIDRLRLLPTHYEGEKLKEYTRDVCEKNDRLRKACLEAIKALGPVEDADGIKAVGILTIATGGT